MTAAEVAAALEAEAERRQGKRRRRPACPSALEEALRLQLERRGLRPEREHRFHTRRRWRFDFAWPELRLAVEVEGGTWSTSRHTSGQGFADDCEKYNAAAIAGWCVLRYTDRAIKSGLAAHEIAGAVAERS